MERPKLDKAEIEQLIKMFETDFMDFAMSAGFGERVDETVWAEHELSFRQLTAVIVGLRLLRDQHDREPNSRVEGGRTLKDSYGEASK